MLNSCHKVLLIQSIVDVIVQKKVASFGSSINKNIILKVFYSSAAQYLHFRQLRGWYCGIGWGRVWGCKGQSGSSDSFLNSRSLKVACKILCLSLSTFYFWSNFVIFAILLFLCSVLLLGKILFIRYHYYSVDIALQNSSCLAAVWGKANTVHSLAFRLGDRFFFLYNPVMWLWQS